MAYSSNTAVLGVSTSAGGLAATGAAFDPRPVVIVGVLMVVVGVLFVVRSYLIRPGGD